ncbi:MAG: NAD-dependent epimerase/dehydratase family protein [Gammaproteobacteria bacterium]|nr:NAD-dependent epimerase/dehydratase family protein [Gammaproteobacteria bacterium]
MRVLVTGGSGFIGSAVLRRLQADGISMRATWHSREGRVTGVEWARVEAIDSPQEWLRHLSGCDAVVHCAALAHQPGGSGSALEDRFHRVNVAGTRALAAACVMAQIRRLVFLSSVAAVCSESEIPVDDNYSPAPIDAYGRSKLQAEHALSEELGRGGIEWCSVRPPLVYGRGNPGNMARLLWLIDSGLPLPFGLINNRRSLLFVGNLVDALCCVLRHPQSVRGSYLLSDDGVFSTPQLVRLVAAARGRPVRLLPVPPPALRLLGDLSERTARVLGANFGLAPALERLTGSLCIDSTRFRAEFAWQPPIEPVQAVTNSFAKGS